MAENKFTLDALTTQSQIEYKDMEVEFGDGKTAVLLNPLRLPKEQRDELAKTDESPVDEDGNALPEKDQVDIFRDYLRVVAQDKDIVNELIDAIGDNLALLVHLFRTYNKAVQAGEA